MNPSLSLKQLYQQVILDHSRHPRHRGLIPDAHATATGHNPLCGDRLVITARFKDGVVESIAFDGEACAICTASASMMTQVLLGESKDKALEKIVTFQRLLTEDSIPNDASGLIGKLTVFHGVREFPLRVKCATLPWHTARACLGQESQAIVSTEV